MFVPNSLLYARLDSGGMNKEVCELLPARYPVYFRSGIQFDDQVTVVTATESEL